MIKIKEKRLQELFDELRICRDLLNDCEDKQKKIKLRMSYILGAITLLQEQQGVNDNTEEFLTSAGL